MSSRKICQIYTGLYCLLTTSVFLLGGCASEPSSPQPLPSPPPQAATLKAIAATQSIDLSRPLDASSLAAIAVFANPDLVALRAGEGVADAQVFAAGLYPDPTFTLGFDVPLNGNDTTTAFGLGVGFDFAALARRPSAMRSAEANLETLRLDIAWSEWLTGEQARLLAIRVAHLRGIRSLTSQLRVLADEDLSRSLRAVSRGDLSNSTLEASRLAAADAADRERNSELQLRSAELALNRLLGLDPAEQLVLAPAQGPIGTVPADEILFSHAVASRADLAALRSAYEGSSAAVDAAKLGRYPLPSMDINAARDTSDIKTLGPSVTFALPLWNRGRGDVAVASANQAQLRADYIARLATIRADIAAASAGLEVTRLQSADVARELLPLAPQVEASARAAARGDLSLAAANAARMTLLDKQIVEASLALSIAELELALEISVGRSLENIE